MFPLEAMGCTAENIVITSTSHEKQVFAYNSHQKALQAIANGAFDEIIPITVPKGRRDTITITQDEGPRVDTSLEKLAKLRPAFRKENGTVTAGNSSTLNDGSAAMIVSTKAKAEEFGLQPIAKIISCASAGVDPEVMGLGPVPATKKALFRARINISELDLIELNEAFAAQSLGVCTNWSSGKVNIQGSDRFGTPIRCSRSNINNISCSTSKKCSIWTCHTLCRCRTGSINGCGKLQYTRQHIKTEFQ